MPPPTRTYHIYSFDGARHLVTADFFEAANDRQAVAKAERAGFGTKCELWDGRRLVAQLEAAQTA